MAMRRTDNPLADFEMHEAEQEAKLEKLPKCIRCKEPIQQEDAVKTPFGWYCDVCLEDLRREIVLNGE